MISIVISYSFVSLYIANQNINVEDENFQNLHFKPLKNNVKEMFPSKQLDSFENFVKDLRTENERKATATYEKVLQDSTFNALEVNMELPRHKNDNKKKTTFFAYEYVLHFYDKVKDATELHFYEHFFHTMSEVMSYRKAFCGHEALFIVQLLRAIIEVKIERNLEALNSLLVAPPPNINIPRPQVPNNGNEGDFL